MTESISQGDEPAPVPAIGPEGGPVEPGPLGGAADAEGAATGGDDRAGPAPVLVFRLRRYARQPGDDAARALALATLEFDYGGVRVAGHSPADATGEPRSRGAELAAEERLEALGMTPLLALGEVAAALAHPPQPNEWVLPRPRGVAPSSRLLRLMPRLTSAVPSALLL